MSGENFDTGKLDALVASLQLYQEAQEEVKACYAKCETSPDYFCALQREYRQEAANEFGKRLKAFVMDCIEAHHEEKLKAEGRA